MQPDSRGSLLVTNKEADSLVTLIVIDKASLCAEPLSIIRNLHHQIKQTNCNVHRACACCLGQWVNNQRQSKTNGKLSAERIELLDGLSFGWSRVRN